MTPAPMDSRVSTEKMVPMAKLASRDLLGPAVPWESQEQWAHPACLENPDQWDLLVPRVWLVSLASVDLPDPPALLGTEVLLVQLVLMASMAVKDARDLRVVEDPQEILDPLVIPASRESRDLTARLVIPASSAHLVNRVLKVLQAQEVLRVLLVIKDHLDPMVKWVL